jgi:hypothetical protein
MSVNSNCLHRFLFAVNMIHATHIWAFMLLILYVFLECGNRLDIEMGVFTLSNLYTE